MTSVLSGSEVAVLAVLGVLTIFLFPAVQGPYSVVHGPVTALLALRAAVRLRLSIVLSALTQSGKASVSPLFAVSHENPEEAAFRPFRLAECDNILRC